MPKPYPKEFDDDDVAVARKAQGPLSQIAKDFGISEGCLHHLDDEGRTKLGSGAWWTRGPTPPGRRIKRCEG